MNINEAKKNLRAHLHLLPESVQADVEFLLKKFDETTRELNELKRNAASRNNVVDLPNEEWRDVGGYEGIYQVSNMGRVKSLHWLGGRLLTPSANKGGYMYVVLSKHSVAKSIKVHTLVARAFIPNPENKPIVHHRDSNRTNNRVENLEWVTYSENSMYAVQNGSYDKNGTYVNPASLLPYETVRYIRKNYIKGDPEFGQEALARKFKVKTNVIFDVVHYNTYKYVD